MPAWDEYKSIAKERGALALELYVVRSTPIANPDVLRALLPEHLDYQATLEKSGKLFLAGPMSDETGEQMQGMGNIIYRAMSMDEARALADADPMHAKGGRSYELRKWLVNEGNLSLSVGLSTNLTQMS